MQEHIALYHGDGGKYTNQLINELFYKYFDNDILLQGSDAAVFHTEEGRLAFTTDSFVIKPLFFPGGNIGKLSIFGTVNDLAVSGANPQYLSAGFIIEEGLSVKDLECIVHSMGQACKDSGVKIITGDTKVVERGSTDGLFINTTGIGFIYNGYVQKKVEVGDQIIITGSIAEHGTAVALERYKIKASGNFVSDCASVYEMLREVMPYHKGIKLMRDPTRGGLATILNEIASSYGVGIKISEKSIPIRTEVTGLCSILGIDPLYLASEGRALLIVAPEVSDQVLGCIQRFDRGKEASIIGSIIHDKKCLVYMETAIGGKRLLNPLDAPMLPRIC